MAVEPDRGVQVSPATLQSPTMNQASTTCTLHFFYNMYGEGMFTVCLCTAKKIAINHQNKIKFLKIPTFADIEELNVLLKEGSRTTRLWWLSGNQGDLWQHSEVTVGRIPQDFTILFEASRSFDTPGYIAIDDVDFTNCTLPGRLPALTMC